jgi:hypothetical protein
LVAAGLAAMPALNELLSASGLTLQTEVLDRVDRDKAHLLPPATGAPRSPIPQGHPPNVEDDGLTWGGG